MVCTGGGGVDCKARGEIAKSQQEVLLSLLHHTPHKHTSIRVTSTGDTCTATLPVLHHSALPAATEKAGGRRPICGMNGKDQ